LLFAGLFIFRGLVSLGVAISFSMTEFVPEPSKVAALLGSFSWWTAEIGGSACPFFITSEVSMTGGVVSPSVELDPIGVLVCSIEFI
jgi:hypothetical protein